MGRMRQITKNLYKRQYMRCRTELAEARSQFIKMDYDSRCAKCGKRIGDAVFILKPKTLQKLHYSCFYRKRQPKSPQFQSAEVGGGARVARGGNEQMEAVKSANSRFERVAREAKANTN